MDAEEKWLTKGFLALLLTLFLIFLAATYLSANQSFVYANGTFQGGVIANQTATNQQSERQSASALSIFANNLEVSIAVGLPIVGLLPFSFVVYNTGQVLGFLCAFVGISPATYFLTISPVLLPEMFAYSLLAAEATYVGILALTRSDAKERIKRQSWKTFLAYILVLFITAVGEAMWIGATR
jgi:hypothetical protein